MILCEKLERKWKEFQRTLDWFFVAVWRTEEMHRMNLECVASKVEYIRNKFLIVYFHYEFHKFNH